MNYPNSGGSGVAGILGGAAIFITIFSLAVLVFTIIIYWRIVSKAGYNGAWSLLLFVPIVNLIMICIFAFGEWPIYRELNQLRQQVAMGQQQYQQYPQPPQQYQQYPQHPQNPQPPYPQYPQNS